jgi:branched-subunit amino acid aminotransferase/4-amino-4-deoxychorismate lyase
VRWGEADFPARHIARLQRDAALIGSEPPEVDRILEAFSVLGRAVFGEGQETEGVIRLELRPDEVGRSMLIARARPLGADAPIWRGTLAPFVHPGGGAHPGVKHTERPVWTRGRAHATDLGLDEALLCDETDQLVEGARSALIVDLGDGALAFPDPALGGVASIGLAVLREHAGGLEPRCIPVGALREAREVIAVNAVRGVRPIVAIDGTDVGDGRAGPAARRLASAFDAALQEESRSSR